MTETIRLGFTGDVMLGRLVNERQQHRPPHAVWGSMREPLQSLDGLFVNLECCLSTRGQQWQRTHRPFHFRADPKWAIPALQDVGVAWVTLANNHVLDYEEVALEDTFDALENGEIPYAGAGRTEADAWEPSHVQVAGLDVALVAFTDNTPEYAADGESPGTAHVPIDPDDDAVLEQVEAVLDSARKADPDVLVASLHWGPNMREHPPQSFQDFAHWLVERGVDILHGHSAHVFQGVEVYDDSVILYDTGDFVDDYAVDESLRNDRGFLFEIRVSPTGSIHDLHLHPTEIGELAVHRASQPAAQWCRTQLRERSSSFGTRFERVDDGLRVEIRE